MAETFTPQLARAYQQTGSAYDQKAAQYANFFQSIKNTEVAKQQMQEEMDRQMELVEFKSDVQLDRQKEYFQEVTKPQQQQEAARQQLQQQMEQVQEQFKNAQESVRDLQDQQAEKNNLSKYNLGMFRYRVEPQLEGEQLVGAQPSIYFQPSEEANPQQVDYGTYRNELEQLDDFGRFLSTLEDAELGESGVEEKGGVEHEYVGRGQKDQYIQQVKTNPEFRWQEYQKFKQGRLHPAEKQSADKSASSGKAPASKAYSTIGSLREALGGGTSKEFRFSQDVSWLPFAGETAGAKEIDFTSSVRGVKKQINDFFTQIVLPKGSSFDLGKLTRKQRNAIIAGDTSGEFLDTVPDDMYNTVEDLASLTGTQKQTVEELVKYYNVYDELWSEVNESGEMDYSQDEVKLDIWNAPREKESMDDFRKYFKKIDRGKNDSAVIGLSKEISRKSDWMAELYGYESIGQQ